MGQEGDEEILMVAPLFSYASLASDTCLTKIYEFEEKTVNNEVNKRKQRFLVYTPVSTNKVGC